MVKTLAVKDILAATASSHALADLLHLDILSSSKGYQSDIRPALQQAGICVNSRTAVNTSNLAKLLGLDATSPPQLHRHLITDMVSSYKMSVPYHSHDEWLSIASHYTHTLTQTSPTPIPLTTQALLHHAFLTGVQLGASHSFRLSRLHHANEVQKLQDKARRNGLGDPGKVVMREADGVKIAVGVEGRRLSKLLEGGQRAQPRALEGVRQSRRMVEEDEPDAEDGLDDNDGGDDDGSVFEFGDDGLMV